MTARSDPLCRILVVAHKPCRLPDDPLYLPILVNGCPPFVPGAVSDGSGDHIAGKNREYCELTALYWAWKNLHADFIGLAHYRRYFVVSSFLRRTRKWMAIPGPDQFRQCLARHTVILPRPRRYYIETRYSHFVHAHGEAALLACRRVLEGRCPDYLPAFETVMSRRSGHIWNMFIMRRDLLHLYCTWLFDCLFAVGVDLKETPPRLMGYLGERLLDVWLERHAIPYAELPVIHMERVNWPLKIAAFLGRKFKRGPEWEKPL
jgi:hypothetical protein